MNWPERELSTCGICRKDIIEVFHWVKRIQKRSLCHGVMVRTNICLFAARCCRYIIVYNAHHDLKCELTFELIQKFIKKTKTHCNIGYQEKGFVEQAWRESISEIVWIELLEVVIYYLRTLKCECVCVCVCVFIFILLFF